MEQIISASGTQYGLIINSDGSMPVSGTFTATVTATVNAGSTAYNYGHSGTTWWPLLVESGTGKLITSTTAFIASGGDIGSVYIKDGAFINIFPSGGISYSTVTPSGTFYSSVLASGTTGLPISGVMTVTDLATAGSLATQGIIGSVQLTTAYFPGSVNLVDGAYLTGSINQAISPWNINKKPINYTGSIVATDTGFAGSTVVALNNEVNWLSVKGLNSGSTYKFGMIDTDGYLIQSQLARTGNMSFLTPFFASGNVVFNITEAQVSGTYGLRLGYI